MKREHQTMMVLVVVISVLATLLAVDLLGREPAHAQSSPGQAGYLTVVAGPAVRDRHLPIVVVDSQQLTLMTYDYTLTGTSPELRLTNVRSLRYDRRMNDYNVGQFRNPQNPPSRNNANSVEDMRRAAQRQPTLE